MKVRLPKYLAEDYLRTIEGILHACPIECEQAYKKICNRFWELRNILADLELEEELA